MKRILIGTVAMIMALPAFADDTPMLPMGGYSCTMTYRCGSGTGNTQQYTNTDANNMIITVATNSNCSKSGDTFSHWAVSYCNQSYPVSNPIAHPGESYDITGCLDDTNDNFCFTAVYASEVMQSITTSKPYFDTQIETTQAKIPATNPSNTNIGERVVTYTNVSGGGVIGERQLFTGENAYTAGDADKLITASALNDRFTNLPTTGTTKLECANQSAGCTLWTIIDQTAYGTTTIDLTALAGMTPTGICYKTLSDGTVSTENCTTTPSNYGDWGTMFTYNNEPVQVSGISACSTLSGTYAQEASDQARVQRNYESNLANAPTTSPVGRYCYCKLTDPSISAARWVFMDSYGTAYSTASCAYNCAYACAINVRNFSDFRSAVFGAVQ